MKKTILKRKIETWRQEVDKSGEIPTIASFRYKNKIAKSTISEWKTKRPELHELYKKEVVEYVEMRVTRELLNGTTQRQTALIFYLKAALRYRENDKVQDANTLPIIQIGVINEGKNKLKK